MLLLLVLLHRLRQVSWGVLQFAIANCNCIMFIGDRVPSTWLRCIVSCGTIFHVTNDISWQSRLTNLKAQVGCWKLMQRWRNAGGAIYTQYFQLTMSVICERTIASVVILGTAYSSRFVWVLLMGGVFNSSVRFEKYDFKPCCFTVVKIAS